MFFLVLMISPLLEPFKKLIYNRLKLADWFLIQFLLRFISQSPDDVNFLRFFTGIILNF
jgi:hypothetical protein